MFEGAIEKAVVNALDTGSRVQAPAVTKYVDWVRSRHPDEDPAQIVKRLEQQFLHTVTGSGTAIGATAAVPGVGTVTALAAVSAETAFFMEASALFTLAVAEIHGITPENKETRRALVISVVLGDSGKDIIQKNVGVTSKNWATVFVDEIPGVTGINSMLLKRFITRFFKKRAAMMFGKLIPAGIGAAIGGFGNRTLGRRTIDNARKAFGPPPRTWAETAKSIDADPLPALDAVKPQ